MIYPETRIEVKLFLDPKNNFVAYEATRFLKGKIVPTQYDDLGLFSCGADFPSNDSKAYQFFLQALTHEMIWTGPQLDKNPTHLSYKDFKNELKLRENAFIKEVTVNDIKIFFLHNEKMYDQYRIVIDLDAPKINNHKVNCFLSHLNNRSPGMADPDNHYSPENNFEQRLAKFRLFEEIMESALKKICEK